MTVLLARLGPMLLLAALAAAPARAWSPAGHETIGALADRLIAGTPAERHVRAILGPGPAGTLQVAGLWADCVRGVSKRSGAFVFTVDARYPECAPYLTAEGQREMIGYVERNWTACRPRTQEELCHEQYHYANVAIERDGYARGVSGASDHDVVGAIDAAIAVLAGGRAPPPFALDRREALRLLAHAVADLHQPLHVAAVYLEPSGRRVDPDRMDKGAGAATGTFAHTRGGGRLVDGRRDLHGEWDRIEASERVERLDARRVAAARAIARTAGPPQRWAAQWATETLRHGRSAYEGVRIGRQREDGRWPVTETAGYDEERIRVQHEQLTKAGARLAQLLQALFPR